MLLNWCCYPLLRKPNQKVLPHFYSYIDTQIVCWSPACLSSRDFTQRELKENEHQFCLSLMEYFLAIYAAISPNQTFAFSSRWNMSPAHIYLESWLCRLAWHVNLICASQFILFSFTIKYRERLQLIREQEQKLGKLMMYYCVLFALEGNNWHPCATEN